MALDHTVIIRAGIDGLELHVDDIVVRTGLKPTEAMEALHETRRLALCSGATVTGMLDELLARRTV